MKKDKPKIALIGLGRLQLGLVAPVYHKLNFDIYCVNFKNEQLVEKLDTHKNYRVVYRKDQEAGITVGIKFAKVYNQDLLLNEADQLIFFQDLLDVDIINFGLGQEYDAVSTAAKFLLEFGKIRRKKGCTSPLFVTCSDNPKGTMFGSDEIRKKLMELTLRLETDLRIVLWNDMYKQYTFVQSMADRICTYRIVDSNLNIPVKVIVEEYGMITYSKSINSLGLLIEDIRKSPNITISEDIELSRQKKLYIINMAHAVIAYLGYFDPSKPKYIHEAIKIFSIRHSIIQVLEAVSIAFHKKSGEPINILNDYIKLALSRFENEEIKDEIQRVARDVSRKILRNDRLLGPLLLIYRESFKVDEVLVNAIANALTYAYNYGETIPEYENDHLTILLKSTLHSQGIGIALQDAGLCTDDVSEMFLMSEISELFNTNLKKFSSTSNQVITACNDLFAKTTVIDRFQKIYDDLNLKYDLDEPVSLFLVNEELIPSEITIFFNNKIKSAIKKINKSIESVSLGDFYLNAEFLVVEFYFYYDIIRKKGKNVDPYYKSKLASLVENKEKILASLNNSIYSSDEVSYKKRLPALLKNCLIGNITDLSQIRQNYTHTPHILHDDSEKVVKILVENRVHEKVDLIVDNAGLELIQDLALAIALLKWGLTKKVVIHLNVLPIFVSDAIHSSFGSDIDMLKLFFKDTGHSFVEDLTKFELEEKIVWAPNHFWNSCLQFDEMNSDLSKSFHDSDLIIIKGDLNYRRLVGDINWPIYTSIKKIGGYLNSPTLIIRTLKSNVVLGLSVDSITKIGKHREYTNQQWKTCGKYGVIQLIES